MALCIGGLGLLPAYYLLKPHFAHHSPIDLADLPDHATSLRPGPWGNLETIPIRIAPPEEYLPIASLQEHGRRWNFVGYSPEMVSALFATLDLSSSQKAELLDITHWKQDSQGISIEPSSDLVFSLSTSARKAIYNALLQIPASGVRSVTAYFRVDRFDEIFAQSGLSKEVVENVKRLSFPHGHLLFFCDAAWVLEKIESYDEKVLFLRTIIGKSTLLMRLHVMPDTNINSLLNYWTKAAWGKDVKPMLESLAKIPGGARLSLVHLLPPMPTQCLYTFPFPSSDAKAPLKDCHWVALNFFRDPPDLSLTDHEMIRKAFQEDYYPVQSDARYGDLVQLVRANGDIIHTAVFIADDIVFTKNSADAVEPYMLMKFDEMVDAFSVFVPESESLRLVILRNKYY